MYNEIGRKITDKLIEIYGPDMKIAFFPYKRSMWNSMQSVYDECKASGIEAHCVPIPYYRMGPGQTVDHIDSDFDLFGPIAEPVSVLEGLKLDCIAIQYQYENHNRVTNMLPEYFTMAIKERYNCDIIYLPYGIGSGGASSHFILQPGVCNVDYAFLETEANADRFIREWQKAGVDFTGRVFVYGSPKLDIVGNLISEIPEKWEYIIDGRSVTLIANSLGPFLVDPLSRIILYKDKARAEVAAGRAVIFRPHPLLRTTIKSMQPIPEYRYDQMLEDLKRFGHVIIDESEYLERAFGICDKMLSDSPSLVPMWAATGKPYEVLG